MRIKDLPIGIRIFYIINTQHSFKSLMTNKEVLNSRVCSGNFTWANCLVIKNVDFWEKIVRKYENQRFTDKY